MVNIEQIKNVCDELDGNCHACPFSKKDEQFSCPFLSEDPMDWGTDWIDIAYNNSPLRESSDCVSTKDLSLKKSACIFEAKSCLACGATAYFLKEVNTYRIHHCVECGLEFCSPMPTENEINWFYREYKDIRAVLRI